MNVRDYHRSVHLSKMKRLMAYDLAAYKEDWDTAVALAMLMASGDKDYFEPMLESCFDRILAFNANNPNVLPFDYYKLEGIYDSD